MIVIVAYNGRWPQEFEQIKANLSEALGSLALRIDHIGSTSVPGLGAKDVIDVQITVGALTEAARQALLTAGFQQFRENVTDHVPSGEDPTPENWQKFLFVERAGERRANIHVRVAGKPNQHYPLLFRDYLRAHPKSAEAVEIIKRQLAKHHGNDKETYYDIKDPVYDLIWDAAQRWAKFTNWSL
ncbi:GrpB family protein [Candidatus Leptofilum sp.]|uniref:GrpB family protein n=1 Tax=Candidatus Leptofilum sp. TaxID=3241576 RepID=UPI003B58F9F4